MTKELKEIFRKVGAFAYTWEDNSKENYRVYLKFDRKFTSISAKRVADLQVRYENKLNELLSKLGYKMKEFKLENSKCKGVSGWEISLYPEYRGEGLLHYELDVREGYINELTGYLELVGKVVE